MEFSPRDRDIIEKVKEARKATVRQGIDLECGECTSLYSQSINEITKGFCPDCFLEIEYGIIPIIRGR